VCEGKKPARSRPYLTAADSAPTPVPDAIEGPAAGLAQEVPPISRSTTTSGRTRLSTSGRRYMCTAQIDTYSGQ